MERNLKIFILIYILAGLFTTQLVSVELPANFPPFEIKTLDKPAPGNMMFVTRGTGFGNYLVITDSAANVLKFKPVTGQTSNFAVQSNGLITYNTVKKGYFKAYSEATYYIADTNLTIIDSITGANGFVPAPHVSEILPNGHYLFSSFSSYPVDMSKVVENGNPNAIVAGAALIEMDANKNVVFQWRSWDYINIEDTYQPINDFLNIITLYSNFNSVAVDKDGNFYVCNRLLSEITKVNRSTGEIMWRFGGKYNQFTVVNEDDKQSPIYFSLQHDIRILPNGNITLFDNGDQHEPPFSRAVEYQIDEQNMIATKVWEYVPTVNVFAESNASVQRLSNGNTIIGWGNTANNPTKIDITEVNPDGKVEFEMALPKTITAFKALKFPYPIGKESSRVFRDELLPLNTYRFDVGTNKTGVKVVFSKMAGFMYNTLTVTKYDYAPMSPKFEGPSPYIYPYRFELEEMSIENFECELTFNIEDLNLIVYPEKTIIYHRESPGNGMFIPLETKFNSETNELSVNITSFGEFVFGVPYIPTKPSSPFLVMPKNQAVVLNDEKVKIEWCPKGYFKTSSLMVSDNQDFAGNHNLTFLYMKETFIELNNLEPNTTYYWKVRSENELHEGEWSEVQSFTLGESYLQIIEPNGGEVWTVDELRKFVRWNKNSNDAVRIELLLDDESVLSLTDSIVSLTGAFATKLSQSITESDKYKIKITSLINSDIFSMSDNYFTIKNPAASVNEKDYGNLKVSCFPNPANLSTTFEIESLDQQEIEINISDMAGQFIANAFKGTISKGTNYIVWKTIDLPSGSYFYSVKFNNRSIADKLLIAK